MDENGQVVWIADYEPFGRAEINPISSIENHFRFPGQYCDAQTDLHYNGHRDYNPDTGRYLTPDPIGLSAGINLYAYANANPVNVADPSGLYSFGLGAYFGGGAEISWNVKTCCDFNKRYRIRYLTICGGVGLGVFGLSPVGPSLSLAGVSSRENRCIASGYFFRHSTSLIGAHTGVNIDKKGFSGDIDFDLGLGAETSWKFCSHTVFSKRQISDCCNDQ
jgi:RHS repeat-associated protein